VQNTEIIVYGEYDSPDTIQELNPDSCLACVGIKKVMPKAYKELRRAHFKNKMYKTFGRRTKEKVGIIKSEI
jgi:hypothetical protein